MRLTEISPEIIQNLDRTFVEKLLFDDLEYTGERADLIMVLGGRNAVKYRLPTAIRLFNSDKADMLLLSGGNLIQTDGEEITECEAMRLAAVKSSVPEACIICEDKSTNTAENFRCSGKILSERFPQCKAIILVTSAFHMRRATLLAKRQMSGYKIIPCPVNIGSAGKDNWFATEKGTRHIKGEISNLVWCAKNNLIDDYEL